MAKSKNSRCPILPATEEVVTVRTASKELYSKGWKTIHIDYHGSGDECDSITFSLANDETTVDFAKILPSELPPDFKIKKLEDAIWNLLPAGFENNEGGDGAITVDISTGAITVTHNAYHTISTKSEWQY